MRATNGPVEGRGWELNHLILFKIRESIQNFAKKAELIRTPLSIKSYQFPPPLWGWTRLQLDLMEELICLHDLEVKAKCQKFLIATYQNNYMIT